jgi:hypothetical protein
MTDPDECPAYSVPSALVEAAGEMAAAGPSDAAAPAAEPAGAPKKKFEVKKW